MMVFDSKSAIEFEIPDRQDGQQRSSVLIACRKFLTQYDLPSPALDARLILLQAIGISDLEFAANPQAILSPAQIDRIEALLRRRARGEPVSRLFGEREFYSLAFKITDATLDPRPDSETLIDVALEQMKHYVGFGSKNENSKNENSTDEEAMPARRVLDLGTGSGCLLISLLSEMRDWSGHGVDIDDAAVLVAQNNAQRLGLQERTLFYQSSWFDKVETSFDMIISNPPYIPTRDIAALAPDVRLYDPMMALDGGADGLDAYRNIIRQAKPYLRPFGRIIFEIGFDQADALGSILEAHNFSAIDLVKDLQGNDRVVVAQIAE